jgi:hypothetical protein
MLTPSGVVIAEDLDISNIRSLAYARYVNVDRTNATRAVDFWLGRTKKVIMSLTPFSHLTSTAYAPERAVDGIVIEKFVAHFASSRSSS